MTSKLAHELQSGFPSLRMSGIILLVDSDLGFLFWLGRVLDQAGYQAFPAKSVVDAVTLVGQLRLPVSVLILDCSLPDAESLITRMRRSRKFLKTICLGGDGRHVCSNVADAVCVRPVQFDEQSKAKWLHTVRGAVKKTPQPLD
jgi:DNA-binding response OmpR family regulator